MRHAATPLEIAPQDQARQILSRAIELHRRGATAEATTLYRQVLALDPFQSDAAHFLGIVTRDAGDAASAERLLRQAIATNDRHPAYHASLGLTLRGLGRSAEAAEAYKQAVGLKPDFAEAQINLGNLLLEMNDHAGAVAAYRAALLVNSQFSEGYNNLSVALFALGEFQAALAAVERAVALAPTYSAAHNNRGRALEALGRFVEAEQAYRRALTLGLETADIYNNLGLALEAQQRLDAALAAYEKAIELDPACGQAHNNRGGVLKAMGRIAEAAKAYEAALAATPNVAEVHCNLGVVRHLQRHLAGAIASYDCAVALKPDYAKAHWNRAIALLLSGNLRDGFAAYEWRQKYEGYLKVQGQRWFPIPQWDGTAPHGRRLLVTTEQGLGDILQFIRLLAPLSTLGADVMFECPPRLQPLVARCQGIGTLIDPKNIETAARAADAHVPLMSLPDRLGLDVETIPGAVPYVWTDPALTRAWAERLDRGAALRVGLCWQGSQNNTADSQRSITARTLAPLGRIPRVRLYSLQVGFGSEQSADIPGLVDFAGELDQKTGAFMDTAALINSLDLVITVDTSIAHLAGALGRPVWTMLCYMPDWRWMLDRGDSPWYPTMRLFRQTEKGDWGTVIDRVVSALAQLASEQ
jgi:tetratricopeptide (TPR) repeat protein